MKKLSVKQKVVIWFTAILLIIAALVYTVLQSSIVRQSREFSLETLQRAAEAVKDEIELEDGVLEIDDDIDSIDYAGIMIYSADGTKMLYGRIPEFDAPLSEGAARQIQGDGGSAWYVYDTLHKLSEQTQLWVRVCTRMDSSLRVEQYTQSVFLWMMLPLVLLGVLGGYIVTRRAFRPMAQIADTAQRIAVGNDLSKRIGLQGGDEFARLAEVFDAMLARLQAAFEQERRFTSDASHELRTPLAVISSQCELALQEDDTVRQHEALLIIQAQTEKLSRMVKELLTLSRMDANTQQLRLEPTDLSAIAEAVVDALRGDAEKKNISIETELQPGCVLPADEMMMMRMLINLCDNAIRFGRESGYIRLIVQRNGDWIEGRIEDNGIGIAPGQLSHIWERFWQADPARSGENGSSGLGLSMVEWIIRSHGGTIEVKSQPDEGSVFSFRLPAKGAAS